MIDTYFHWLNALIEQFVVTHISQVTFEKRSQSIGFVRGELRFLDNSCLHFREYVNVERGTERYMYVYHYQHADGSLVFRYDNTPHFPIDRPKITCRFR